MTHLHAVLGPPEPVTRWLAATWEDGDAALVLPEDAPTQDRVDVLNRLRPATLTELDPDGPARVQGLADPRATADDVALVVATSGSTGTPKGVELTEAALTSATDASLARLGAQDGERWALALPLHHVAGIAVVRRAWTLGDDPVPALQRDRLATVDADHVALVPTQLARALDDRVDLARFRTILLGGGPAPPDLLDRARAAGATVVVSYGMTETAGGCVYDGHPLDGVDVEVDSDDRIRLRGPMLFRGYRGDPGATAAAFDGDWFVTGDRGRWHDGRLEVLGRADEVVVSGGENIPVAPVVSALRSHPTVADAAATGRPDPTWGQALVAVVVPVDPRHPPDLVELRAHVRQQLPAHHAPRGLAIVDRLPRDHLGKLRKDALDRLVSAAG